MTGDLIFGLFVGFGGGLLSGIAIGEWAEASKWRYRASVPARMLSGGRFFYVVEDGDLQKAKDVAEMEEHRPR